MKLNCLLQFICLSVCIYVLSFFENDWIFFSETLNMDLWGIGEVVANIKNSHLSPTLGKGAFWVIFAHFCRVFLHSLFSWERFHILSWNLENVFGVTMLQKITAWHSLLGVILGNFWAHFAVCSNISWEPFNIFPWNFIQMFLVYSNGHYTIFLFMSCPPGVHSGVCSSISWESFNIFSWNFV